MTKKSDLDVKFADLRSRASILLTQNPKDISARSLEDIHELVYQLDTYQIELELQNEDLRQVQEHLDRSRKRFSDLFDFAPVGYLTISDKGLIDECNLTAAKMIGEERGYLLSQPLTRFIVDEDQDFFYRHRASLLEYKKRQTCELRMKNKQGFSFYVQMECSISPDVDDDIGQFWMCITDISARKEMEMLLQKSKEEWERSFDAIADIITIQDKDMNIVRANKAANEFFRVKPGELIGKNCYEVFGGFSKPDSVCPNRATLKDAGNYSAEITHDILEKTFNVSTSAITEGGKTEYIVHIAKDITEQKKLEGKLYQANKMEAIGNLAGGIAHDFNNILMAILGYAELSQFKIPAGSPAHEDLDQILVSGKRAADLVQQILTYSRKKRHYFQPVPPHMSIREALMMLRSSLPSTIEICEIIDVECGEILADQTSIHQIIVNLFTNALHAMEDQKGTLTVKLQGEEIVEEAEVPAGSYVVLSVKDTGCGMDKAIVDQIFEPFFTTKGVGKGSGMGLAVIYGIVQDLNGFIRVESTPGEGSTFSVYIPKLSAQPTTSTEDPASEKSETNASPPTGTEHILMVDDEPQIVDIFKSNLEKYGYTVTVTTDSRDALKKIREHPEQFDLLITDQTMPGLSGERLSRAVLEIRPDMPIILCTGHSEIFSSKDALAMGIKKYVSKPINTYEFIVTVREVLDEQSE